MGEVERLSVKTLIDIAHESARENFGRQEFNFSALWAKTWSKAKEFRKESIESWIGTFYTELLIDPRFILVGAKKWKLREFMDYGEYLKVTGKRARDVTFVELTDTDTDGEGTKKVEKARGKKSIETEELSFEVVETEKIKEGEVAVESSDDETIREEDEEEVSGEEKDSDEDSYD